MLVVFSVLPARSNVVEAFHAYFKEGCEAHTSDQLALLSAGRALQLSVNHQESC